MKKYLFLLFIFVALPALSQEVFIVKSIDSILTPAPANQANATCFMYKNNHFKCACRFSNNSKLWVSKPLEKFNGELGTMEPNRHGNIDACRK